MRRVPTSVILALALVTLAVYLFVQAPAPLPEKMALKGRTVPIETVLTIVAAENDVARALYTMDIVSAGLAVGLAFDEKWREPAVEAGPLPALFLREAAKSLQKSPVPLGLFLGSDFPLSPANRFAGKQDPVFQNIRKTKKAEFFHADDTQLYTGMFPDYASAQACVDCHNHHPQSPKKDWQLNDMMGATTWSYPEKEVTDEQLLRILDALHHSFRDAYEAFLAKAQTYTRKPEIGEHWPREGYSLPSAEVFLAEFSRRAAPQTIDRLLDTARASPAGASQPGK
jgi:adenylate cyclase